MNRWFTAVLVRGSFVDGSLDDRRMGDLLYRLIEAAAPDEAYERALEVGRSATDAFTDQDGKAVSLEFLGLADLIELPAGPLAHGAEVYSQLLSEKPSESVVARDELTVFEPEEATRFAAFDDQEISPR